MKSNKQTLLKWISVATALCLWEGAAVVMDRSLLLAAPTDVVKRLLELVREPDFLPTVLFSFSRIVLGFLIAFFAGTALGLFAGRFKTAEIFLMPYMITVRTVPVASFIILSLMFLSGSQLSVFISFLMVLPIIYTNVLEGVKSADAQLLEMARMFRVPYGRRLGYILLPSVKPFLLSGTRAALGLCWKAGIAAEVIAVARGSIGEKLYDAKVYFMTADLLAWTVILVLVSVLFEKLFRWLLEKAFALWEK